MNSLAREPIRIFISHCKTDNDFTRKLADDLRKALGDDTAVWYDHKLPGGTSWWLKIVEELTARNVFIVVVSHYGLKSKWVNDEIDLAWQQKNSKAGKLIVPVICRPIRKKRHDLDTLQNISFVLPNTYSSALNKLLKAIGIEQPTPLNRGTKYHSPAIAMNSTVVSQNKEAPIGEQRVLKIASAFRRGVWSYVIGEIDALVSQYPEGVSSDLYRLQGLAYLYTGKTYHAQRVLAKALSLTCEPEQRLILLDEYTAPFITWHQWREVLRYAEEALQINPNDPTWLMAREEALKRCESDGYIFSINNQDRTYGTYETKKIALKPIRAKLGRDSLEEQPKALSTTYSEIEEYKVSVGLQDTSLETEKRELELQKARLEFERDRITFALETSVMIAEKLYPDVDGKVKAMLTRKLLPNLLQLGTNKIVEINLPALPNIVADAGA